MKLREPLKKTLPLIVLAIFVVVTMALLATQKDKSTKQVSVASYQECIEKEGSVIQESYPQVCVTKSGQKFVQPISTTPNQPKPTDGNDNGGECITVGCSGTLCVDRAEYEKDPFDTTCEYKEIYACYKDATCERQGSGDCGWTMTEELSECLGEN